MRTWLVILLLMVVGCTQTSGTARGIVISVEGSLDEIVSFTLLVEGDEMTFHPTSGGDYAFPLVHLIEHQRTGEPVVVGWRQDDSTRVALSVGDG